MMSSSDIIADLMEQAQKVIATLDKISLKLADKGVNNQNKLPLLSSQDVEGDLDKSTVSDISTDSLCNYGVNESHLASSLPENDSTLSALHVFDINPEPNSGLNVVPGVEIDLDGTQTREIFWKNEVNEEVKLLYAHDVLDEIPLPEFIREMAKTVKFEEETMVSSAHQVFDDLLSSNMESIPLLNQELKAVISAGLTFEHENTLIPTQIQISSPFVKLVDQHVQAKCFICNGIKAKGILLCFICDGNFDDAFTCECHARMEAQIKVFDPGLILMDIVSLRPTHVGNKSVVMSSDLGDIGLDAEHNLKKERLISEKCTRESVNFFCFDPGGLWACGLWDDDDGLLHELSLFSNNSYIRLGVYVLAFLAGNVVSHIGVKVFIFIPTLEDKGDLMREEMRLEQLRYIPWDYEMIKLWYSPVKIKGEFNGEENYSGMDVGSVGAEVSKEQEFVLVDHVSGEGIMTSTNVSPLSDRVSSCVLKGNQDEVYLADGISEIVQRRTWHEDMKRWIVFWTAPEEPCDQFKRRVQQLSAAGIRADYLSRNDLLTMEPKLEVVQQSKAAFLPDYCELEAFIEQGNRFFESQGIYAEFYNDPADYLFRSDGKGYIEGMKTKQNTLYGEKVVIIDAGCWSNYLMDKLLKDSVIVVHVPVKPRKGHLILLENFNPLGLTHGLMEVGLITSLLHTLNEMNLVAPSINWFPLLSVFQERQHTNKLEHNFTMARRVFDPGGNDSEPMMTIQPHVYPYGAKRRKFTRREEYQSYVFDPGGSLVLQDYKLVMLCGVEGVMSFILEDKDNFKGTVMIHTQNRSMVSLVICSLLISLLVIYKARAKTYVII